MPSTPFEHAEWKTAKVHIEVDKTFYSVPHALIGRRVDVMLTYRALEIFFDHKRVASHIRSSQRAGRVTVNEHMPKAHQRYADTTPHSLPSEAAKVGPIRRRLSSVYSAIAPPGTGVSICSRRPLPGASSAIGST